MGKHYIGVDIGGTKILSGVVNKKGKLVSHYKIPTYAEEESDEVIKRVIKSINKAIKKSQVSKKNIKAIGIGAPGQVDSKKGIVRDAQNLSNWKNIKLKKIIESEFGIKTFVDNDVNMGTLGEFTVGAGKKSTNGIAIFIGTGIGGGIFIDGELYDGKNGFAGELGHVIIDVTSHKQCSCGNRGCFEALASRSALSENIIANIKAGRKSVVTKLCENFTKHVKSKVIKKAYHNNDLLTRELVEKECYYLGLGCANYINIFNPDTIVLGGGLMEALGYELIESIRELAGQFALKTPLKTCKIKIAKLGDYSAVIGAAIYAERNKK